MLRIGGRLESEHSLVRGEIKTVPAATRQESHARIGLSAVRLKDQREMAVSGQNLLGTLRTGGRPRRGWMGSKKRLGICGVSDPGLGCTRTNGESDGSDYDQQDDGREDAGSRTCLSRPTAIQSHLTPPVSRDVFSRLQGEKEETAHKQHPDSRPRSGWRTCHQKISAKS